MKQFILSICAFALFGTISLASAETAEDAEILFNWAEKTYPNFFPSHQATQNVDPWIYRYYPESQAYAGVHKDTLDVHVLGGAFGPGIVRIDTLANLITEINNSGGNGDIAACNTSNAPIGITYSQSGNVVTVTSNGLCVPLPSNTNICQVPPQTTASGISVLNSNRVTSSRIEGITIGNGLPNVFQSLVDSTANVKHCTINAPADTVNLVVNSDLCFDITPLIASIPPVSGIEINPPVNYFNAGTNTSTVVPDCFVTDASTISDAFTNEFWIKQSGGFVKVPNN